MSVMVGRATSSPERGSAIAKVEGLSKSFGNLKAVDGLSFGEGRGDIRQPVRAGRYCTLLETPGQVGSDHDR